MRDRPLDVRQFRVPLSESSAVAWWLGPPADALRIGGVGPVQVGRVREGVLSLPLSS